MNIDEQKLAPPPGMTYPRLGITDEQFVRALYKTVFNKENPDQEGLNWWLNDLANGQTREDVAHNFIQHPIWDLFHPPGFGNATTIRNAYENTYHEPIPKSIQDSTGVLMVNAVPIEAILVMFAESSVIPHTEAHPIWWGF